ncbi:hypothetical protein ACXHXM_02115
MSDIPGHIPEQQLLLAAASAASDAAADLVKFVTEGSASEEIIGSEIVERLLDAAKITIEATVSGHHTGIYQAICAELEGWA